MAMPAYQMRTTTGNGTPGVEEDTCFYMITASFGDWLKDKASANRIPRVLAQDLRQSTGAVLVSFEKTFPLSKSPEHKTQQNFRGYLPGKTDQEMILLLVLYLPPPVNHASRA